MWLFDLFDKCSALDRENETEENEKEGKRKRKLVREKKEECITAKRTGCTVASPVGYAKFVSVRGKGAAGTIPPPSFSTEKKFTSFITMHKKKE